MYVSAENVYYPNTKGVTKVRVRSEVVWLTISNLTERGPNKIAPVGAVVNAPKRLLNLITE